MRRIESIQEELQQFFNPNEVIPEESNEQQRLLRISLRICSTVVESLPKSAVSCCSSENAYSNLIGLRRWDKRSSLPLMFTFSGFPWKNQGQTLSQSPFSFRGSSQNRDSNDRMYNIKLSAWSTNIITASSTNKTTASNCSEILSYMGGGEQKELIKKVVNYRMIGGKRTKVSAIVYKTFHRLARTERGDAIKLMVNAVDNVKPVCEVAKVGVAGTIYDVPGIVDRDRQQTLAIRWILGAALKRRISYRKSLEKCSFAEILDAYRKRGIARKRRDNLHGLASTNRSFAHFRWW